ncbi:VOC family protein [Clostridium sp. AN503]|uniref:VOC family protein n=1 Tax=Clostridium sp. AN503 TaxID=3160598 RepID=UPI003459E657
MISPCINFQGNANEAISFYETVFNGTGKQVMKYSDLPPDSNHPVSHGMEDWILHGRLTIFGTLFCFSDSQEPAQPGTMFSFSVWCKTPEEAADIYHRLADSGEILMKLAPQHFARAYAWVRDRFGISWQLICE